MKRVFLDVETTGTIINSDNINDSHRIIEIACIKDDTEKGESTERKEWLINPERIITEESSKIHHITNKDVRDKKKFSEICEEFIEFIKGAKLVIHNAKFDVKFLNNEIKNTSYKNYFIDIDSVIDTYSLAKKITKIGVNLSLDSLARFYRVDFHSLKGQRHRAMFDVELLRKVYHKMSSFFQKEFTLRKMDKKTDFSFYEEYVFAVIFPSTEDIKKDKDFFKKLEVFLEQNS